MTAGELAVVQSRAALAQTTTDGRWPTDARDLARLLRYSTVSQEFVATARRDVLELCAALRCAWDDVERVRSLAVGLEQELARTD